MAFAMDCRPTFATKDWVNRALRFLIFFIIITNLLGWTLLTFLKVTRDENERKKKKIQEESYTLQEENRSFHPPRRDEVWAQHSPHVQV